MRACVTGAADFIGGALVRRLLRSGLSVRALVEPSERADNLRAMGIELASANLADRDSVEQALDRTDVLYHTAQTNLDGTQNVFEACIRRGVPHVVYLSSIAVYGLAQKGEPIDENTPYDPHFHERDHNARSKVEADQYAAAIGAKTKLAVTILRPGTVYGPGKPLPEAPFGFRAGNTNVVFGRRKQHCPLTYVENLADAMAGVSAGRGLRKFIIIDDEDLTLGQYHMVRKELERTHTLFLPGFPLLCVAIGFEIAMWLPPWGFGAGNRWWRRVQLQLQDRRFDTRRIRDETGWAPQVSLTDAIRHTLQ